MSDELHADASTSEVGSTPLAREKTLVDLEWTRLTAALAERCESVLGRSRATSLLPIEDETGAIEALSQSREACGLLAESEPLPAARLADLRAAHARALHGGVLAPDELCGLSELLGAARTLRRFLATRSTRVPTLHATLSTDPSLDAVEEELSRAFDVDGSLADDASPRLRELRTERMHARTRMVSRLEELMRRHASILQDGYWTEREGRYVLPVRADAHERFPGIVHSASSSGATLFVEPRALVPMGNRLKMLEGDVRREEELIYTRLTARVAESIASVGGAIEALATADLCSAIARLSHDLELRFPTTPPRAPDAEFVAELRALRHPLLALEAFDTQRTKGNSRRVVPSDVRARRGRALVVSGPNAGGKTVTLKALGLAALMLRAGLPIAAREGSTLSLVTRVLTDVGDDQSLQKSLSSFSAHILNLRRILDESCPGALVLLDELCGGTDPREGEALAAAVLDGLCRRGAAVMATTHYEGLKALALADLRFENASVGFDEATLTPTFALILGVPGASSALAVARRFGVPSLVIDRAEAYLSGGERTFENTVRALNDERRAMELARSAAEEEHARALDLRQRVEQELETLRARDRQSVGKETEALLMAVRRAREDVRAAQARLRSGRDDRDALRAVERDVAQVSTRVAVGGDLEAHLPNSEAKTERGDRVLDGVPVRKGAKVWVAKLRGEGEVVEVSADGQLRVAVGALKLTLSRAEVRLIVDGPRDGAGKQAARAPSKTPILRSSYARSSREPLRVAGLDTAPRAADGTPEPAIQTSENTCDLRGLRVDDAWPMLESFMDRRLNAGDHIVIAVHGHGTGAVRDHVRTQLKASRYVASFRPGNQHEGGDGVTIVTLA
ncbi:MAG: endonuclease MutS2 [Polyangiales bacterium]